MSDPKVCVVGSLNMDLVVYARELPRAGETVLGARFAQHPGGKGANQAVAAARLGAKAHLIGAIGKDPWGTQLRSALVDEWVDVEHLVVLPEVATGVGVITVLPSGENAIQVASGANLELTADHVHAARAAIEGADVLLQNEVPAAANLRAAKYAQEAGTRIVLNAAPADDLAPELVALADVLIANRAEALAVAGLEPSDEIEAAGAARRIFALGPDIVVVTLGAEGALAFDGEQVLRQPAVKVEAVDTVGAGDAFLAAFVVAQARGERVSGALRHGVAAGALAATVEGGIASMPRAEALAAALPKAAG